MKDGFEIIFTGHESRARQLILEKKIKSEKELATMTSYEVEQTINANFVTIRAGEDWLLIPNDMMKEFNKIITWIER